MISFKEYLKESEVVATNRIGMVHLQKMKDVEFIEFVKSVKTQMQGKLKNLKASLKVDGGGYKFGKDAAGQAFVEGSRTGPITSPGAFSKHAISKGAQGQVLLRAYHYDDLYDIVTKAEFMKVIPNDCKIIGEVLYNPMAELIDDGIKFVSVVYDKSKLGELMTVVPFKVVVASTGQEHPDSEQIIAALHKQSTAKIKFVDHRLAVIDDVDISAIVDPILSLNDRSVQVLNSRLKSDKAEKDSIKSLIQTVKDQVAEYILAHPSIVGKFKLGPNIEGLVLNIDGKDYKVTTQQFKDNKAAEKSL